MGCHGWFLYGVDGYRLCFLCSCYGGSRIRHGVPRWNWDGCLDRKPPPLKAPPIMSKGRAITESPVRLVAHAFTLPELLLVIVVLVILAALLMPALQMAKGAEQNSRCLAQLRNISIGLHAYIADHGGEFPPCSSLPTGKYKIVYQKNTYWYDALNPYMGYPDYAPDRKTGFPAPDAVGTEFPFSWQLCPAKKSSPLERQAIGYGWNHLNFGQDMSHAESTGFGARLYDIAEPSKVIVIGDSEQEEGKTFQSHYLYDYDREKKVPYPTRHFGKGNYLFVDGHIEAFTPEFIKSTEGRRLFKRK